MQRISCACIPYHDMPFRKGGTQTCTNTRSISLVRFALQKLFASTHWIWGMMGYKWRQKAMPTLFNLSTIFQLISWSLTELTCISMTPELHGRSICTWRKTIIHRNLSFPWLRLLKYSFLWCDVELYKSAAVSEETATSTLGRSEVGCTIVQLNCK